VTALLQDRRETLVVTGLGSPTYDVHAAGDRDDNYYLWGAMGGAALVGLGLAQAQPKKRVLVITGDGELLMALGGLATIGSAKPDNLDIVVLDNESYGETGMQGSHTGRGVDLAGVAEACGFARSETLRSMEDVERLAASFPERGKGSRRIEGPVASSRSRWSKPLQLGLVASMDGRWRNVSNQAAAFGRLLRQSNEGNRKSR
jgi:thiamine pyrophosphate-dependent acetolactate synthase large subunit-like protein